MNDGIGRGAIGHRREDHLISWAQTRGKHAEVQRSGTGTDRYRVPRANVGLKVRLESSHFWARSKPTTSQAIHDFVNFGILNIRRAEDKKTISRPDRILTPPVQAHNPRAGICIFPSATKLIRPPRHGVNAIS